MGIFSRRSKAANSADPSLILPIENEGYSVLTLYIDFSDAQGQLTQQLVMGSGRNSNSSKLLWMFLLPARMMKIHSKTNALECSFLLL